MQVNASVALRPDWGSRSDLGATFELGAGPFVNGELAVERFRGREEISKLFGFDISIVTTLESPLFETAVIGQAATLLMRVSGQAPRVVQGIVAWVQPQGPIGNDGKQSFALGLVPKMWLLKRRTSTRIFQDVDVAKVVTAVLDEHGVAHRWQLSQKHAKRNYCVQYEETDYAFVTRLLAEEGIFFYFDPARGAGGLEGAVSAMVDGIADAALGGSAGGLGLGERVVFCDDAWAYPAMGQPASAGLAAEVALGAGGPLSAVTGVTSALPLGVPRVPFRTASGMVDEEEYVRSFALRRTVRSKAVLLRDYDFTRPLYKVTGRASVIPPAPGGVSFRAEGSVFPAANGEPSLTATLSASVSASVPSTFPDGDRLRVYNHHGEYETPDFDAQRAELQVEQLRSKALLGRGRSHCRRLSAGARFVLDEHPTESFNRQYAAVRVLHVGKTPEAHQLEAGVERPTVYENTFTCVPAEIAYRPSRPKRIARQVLETATVVGPANEEIHTDQYGRIKVQFHWDLDGKNDEHSSCWIRVSQAWSGAGWGFQFIPRIGMEVLVSFLGGDTDRPIIVGCVNNATHPPSSPLPVRKTRSGIRSQTTPHGGGWNEVAFEDQKGAEELYFHAQRDLVEHVLRDRSSEIGNDRRQTVKGASICDVHGDRAESTGGARRSVVTGESRETVGGPHALQIGGRRELAVAGELEEDIGGEHTSRIRQGQSVHVEKNQRYRIDGERLVIVVGDEALAVGGDAHTDVGQSASLSVHHDFALAVGSEHHPGLLRTHVHGDTKSTVAGTTEITIEKELVLRVGKNTITLNDKGVKIESPAIELAAASLSASSSKAALSLDDDVVMHGKGIRIFTDQKAILEMSSGVKLDGQTIAFNGQNSAQAKEAAKKKDEAKPLEKETIQLFDLLGQPIPNASYEVTCFGYVDRGTGPSVKVPKFPGVDRCHIRWGRPLADRAAGEPTDEFEYEINVYLKFDHPDPDENVRRKLHNLGHPGESLEEAAYSLYSALGKRDLDLAAVKSEAESRHGSASPVEIKK